MHKVSWICRPGGAHPSPDEVTADVLQMLFIQAVYHSVLTISFTQRSIPPIVTVSSPQQRPLQPILQDSSHHLIRRFKCSFMGHESNPVGCLSTSHTRKSGGGNIFISDDPTIRQKLVTCCHSYFSSDLTQLFELIYLIYYYLPICLFFYTAGSDILHPFAGVYHIRLLQLIQ